MVRVVPWLLLVGCAERLQCGEGTVAVDGWCVVDAPDDVVPVDDSDAPSDTDPLDSPDDTDPLDLDTDIPTVEGRPPFVGAVTFADRSAIIGFCAVHDTVYGNVTVRGTDLTDVNDLACLRRVYGSLTISGAQLNTVSLPTLDYVANHLTVSDARRATVVQLPALQEVGGTLNLGNATDLGALQVVDLGALRRVGTDLRIEDTGALALISLPALTDVGRNLWLRRNDALIAATIPGVTTLGGALRVEQSYSLLQLDLSGLRRVGTLGTAELAIEGNDALHTLAGLPAVRWVSGSVLLRDNAALPVADAEAFVAQLDHVGGLVVIDGAP